MTSLLPRIHQDLFDFIDHDPDELGGLLEFWYRSNSEALSAALTAQSGVNLIVNVSSFQSFESLAKKLFLVADTLVLRDTRKWTQEEFGNRTIPIPIGYWNHFRTLGCTRAEGLAILRSEKDRAEDGVEAYSHQPERPAATASELGHIQLFFVVRLEENVIPEDAAVAAEDNDPVAIDHSREQRFRALQICERVSGSA
jgi:hypothetical protein